MTQKLRLGQKVAAATVDQSPEHAESGSVAPAFSRQQGFEMWKSAAGIGALALFAYMAGPAAQAQETGVASIHSWVKVGRKTCMLDHYHDGNGNGANRNLAERSAISAWAEFTAWEYGSPWGRYSIAVSKKMDCSAGTSGWTCHVQARPCRPY